MQDKLDFWKLLSCWLDTNFARYKLYELEPAWENHWPENDNTGGAHHIVCRPCQARPFLLQWKPPVFWVNKTMYFPADPGFKFEDVFSVVLNQHSYHHQKGPLYTEGWKLKPGEGAW